MEEGLRFGMMGAGRKAELRAFQLYQMRVDIPWLSGRTLRQPWGSYVLYLDAEIKEFVEWMQPSAAELASFEGALERIRKSINGLWPEAKVHVFGSFKAGLALFNSDIDVVVEYAPEREERALLLQLKNHLLRSGLCQKLEARPHAKVPILVVEEKKSGVCMDLQFNRKSGPRAALVQAALLDTFGPLRALVLTLKAFLKTRGLNEPFSGGVGSYCLFLMVVYFLQHHHKREAELGASPRHSVFLLLREFLKFYGAAFHWAKFGISIAEGGFLFDRSRECAACAKQGPPYGTLCVESPEDPENDAARSSFRFSEVAQAFRGALGLLAARSWE